MVLREVIGLHIVAEAVFALREWFYSSEQLDQRGFSRAIHANQRNAVAAFDREMHIAKYFFLAV